jgi:N-acyl-L-homoserine lactone synthetase
MIFVVNSENRQLFQADLAAMHRHRKTVFVDRIGWKIPVIKDMEIDRYDQDDTMYLLAKAEPDSELLASVRLLSTVGPHMMSDLFAAMCRGATPRGPSIWEVSRFCTAPELQGRYTRVELLWQIICGVMETALLYGVDQLIFAANRALLPLALACGWQASTLGPTMRDGDDEVTAVTAAITPDGLRRVRERHGIAVPVTRFHASASPYSQCRSARDGFYDGAQVMHVEANGWIGQQDGDRPRIGEPSRG